MRRTSDHPEDTQFQKQTYLVPTQDSNFCNRYTLGATVAVITAVALMIIGILAFVGISDPTGSLGKFGEVFGTKGAIGALAGGAGLLVTVVIVFGCLYLKRSRSEPDYQQIDQTPFGNGHTGSPVRRTLAADGSNIEIGSGNDPEYTD